ncbi:hypothetical protein Y032_0092g2576 [Ancylostoma ceylanicum]|uniref:Peptidase M13 N-terminal domain-containing protein n=2 Tax=Ancylostoma ceylanicum TaxID=53326 RepID=A0A016TLX9_9BILA|nr:hypothetical protein Y032_0092g2576 [Ancylostoma ceylanicum]
MMNAGYRISNRIAVCFLSELLQFAILEADPCEDFYQFVCGNWIERVGEPKTQISHFIAMWKSFKKQEEGALATFVMFRHVKDRLFCLPQFE